MRSLWAVQHVVRALTHRPTQLFALATPTAVYSYHSSTSSSSSTNQKRAEEDEGDEVGDGEVVAALVSVSSLRIFVAFSLRHAREHDLLPALARRAPDARTVR